MQITNITPRAADTEKSARLAAYCRVSSNSEDQLNSFAAQIRYYSEYAQNHPEYQFVDIYADEGITGTELKKRDELNRLLRDCKKGLIDRIVVKSISRFARNTEELLITLRLLADLGVSVFFEEQGIDSSKLNMEMIVTFPGMAAQQESEAISGNMRWSYQKRMQSGEYSCNCPAYGYSLEKGQLLPHPQEAAVVKRIYALYLGGLGMQAIANLLNNEGVPCRADRKQWYHATIGYILTNEKYIGDALLQKKYTTDTIPFRRKRNHGECAQYYVENSNPPLITREQYALVQELIKSRRTYSGVSKDSILARKLRCPDCGHAFRRQDISGETYWHCSSRAAGETNCKSRRVREEMVFEAFTVLVDKLQWSRKDILEPLISQIEVLQEKTSTNQERLCQIDKELADLGARNLLVARLHTNGILNAADYSKQTSEISSRIASLRTERRNKLAENNGDDSLNQLRTINDLLKDYKWNGIFDAALFEQIVDCITVIDHSKLRFHLIGGLELEEPIAERGRCKST